MKSILLLLGSVLAQDNQEGGCPNIEGGWDDSVKGVLKLDKLVGPWRTIYDHMHDQNDEKCISLKFEKHKENPLLLHLLSGSFQEVHDEDNEHGDFKWKMVYDD